MPDTEILENVYRHTGVGFETKTQSRRHQLVASAFAILESRVCIFLKMRLGKTKAALDWAEHLRKSGKWKGKGLIVVPAPILLDVWVAEAKLHSSMKVVIARISFQDFLNALDSDADLIVAPWSALQSSFTIKKEIESLDADGNVVYSSKLIPDVESLEYLARLFDLVIFDEIHLCKNTGTLRYNIAKLLVKYSEFRCGLTGTAFGRAQPLTAKLLTPCGWKLMGDVKVGDVVIGSSGQPVSVVSVSARRLADVYRVTMNDGASTECASDHLWTVYKNQNKHTLPTYEIIKNYRFKKNAKDIKENPRVINGRTYKIPLVQAPIQFQAKEVPIDGYILGYLLGNGSFSNNSIGLSVSTADEDQIITEFTKYLPTCNMVPILSYDEYAPRNWRISKKQRTNGNSPNDLRSALRTLELLNVISDNKFVPDCYLFNDSGVRLAVLQGLMDSDGTVTVDGTACFNNSSLHLCYAVQHLFLSLGGTSKIYGPYTRGNREGLLPEYHCRGQLPPEISPFRLKRKESKIKKERHHNQLYRGIDNIEYVAKKEVQCITVAAKDGLYITDDFIITHNCPYDVWAQAYLIDDGVTFGKNEKFFKLAFGRTKNGIVVFDTRKKKIFEKRLASFSIAYDSSECWTTPVVSNIQELPMLPEQQTYYKDVINKIIKSGDQGTIQVEAAFTKLRQIGSGYLNFKDDQGETVTLTFPSVKFDWLTEYINGIEPASKIIFFYEFTHTGRKLVELAKKCGRDPVWLYGGCTNPSRELQKFRSGDANVIVIQSASGSVGIDLQMADYQCFVETPVSPVVWEQATHRALGPARKNTLFMDSLVCSPTDKRIFAMVKEGRDLLADLVYQGIKWEELL